MTNLPWSEMGPCKAQEVEGGMKVCRGEAVHCGWDEVAACASFEARWVGAA